MEVGYDFGTTYSTLCYSAEGASGCVSLFGSPYIETQVFIRADGTGYSIVNKPKALYNAKVPGRLYVNPKRWVGVNAYELDSYVLKLKPVHRVEVFKDGSVMLGGIGEGPDRTVSVTDIISLFSKALIKEAEQSTGLRVTGAVVTVPADYNSFKRSFITNCMKDLGIPVRAIVNEPTPAALYSLSILQEKDLFLSAFDFGGGTFDVSFVRKLGDVVCVLLSVGDNFLGARDIDRAVAAEVKARVGESIDTATLSLFAASIKEEVTNEPRAKTHVVKLVDGVKLITFTSEDLNDIVRPFAARALHIYEQAAQRYHPETSVAVLTGGSSALQCVQEALTASKYDSKVVFDKGDFRASDSYSAKIYCDILAGASKLRLVDTLTNTLSDEVLNFRPVIVFSKGSVIPSERTITFNTGGRKTMYGVYEGEEVRSYLNALTFRGEYISNVEGNRTDSATFSVSSDGILSVSVNGTLLKNDLVPSPPTVFSKNLEYLSNIEKVANEGIPEYARQFMALYGQRISREEILADVGAFKEHKIVENYSKRWL
ncbi:heat shock protein 70 [Pineapple mealybug wilt-associated virus 2]|uniref:Heat shock protein 70 n=1 Tax=Pineapple mealybug wilt-associated virus 2 TaxID=136234 RepID=Q9DQ89_9CLOS|nr:heat shock protein 70 [Pineapple mealybug wilt-associated virus 2]AAG13941.1 heat shock protein 70 [Pineapple mealybug wilt-associated virus 2]